MALGLIQGVTELVPVSSSAHLALVPRLLGWRYAELAPAERKAFEVALHAGTAPALALAAAGGGRRPRPALLALTVIPPALAGLALERPDRAPARRPAHGGAWPRSRPARPCWLADARAGDRAAPDAGDHLAVGVAQALALGPGCLACGGGAHGGPAARARPARGARRWRFRPRSP